jgi:pyruvate,water dikinase
MKTQFQGMAVFSGLAQGASRVLTSHKELFKVKQGDIIVVDRVTPLYASAFKKAKGLIIAEGGKLSHAMVLAREYKLPCVILKGATGILHDGDMVEVDAIKGVVRKLG